MGEYAPQGMIIRDKSDTTTTSDNKPTTESISRDYKAEYEKLSQQYHQMAVENGQLIQAIINISKKL